VISISNPKMERESMEAEANFNIQFFVVLSASKKEHGSYTLKMGMVQSG
jgi:hypothetical protein